METQPVIEPDPTTATGPRWRRIVAGVLVVLACLVLLVSAFAVWAKRTVLDTSRFGKIVEAVVVDPAVTDAVAARVAQEVAAVVADSGRVQDALPPALSSAEPILLGALSGFIEDQTAQLLASENIQQLVVRAAETAHRSAVTLLEGDGLFATDALTVEEGVVTLNLVPLVQTVLLRLQERGVIPADVDLPAVGEDVEVPAQVARIGESLGVQLDDDFGQVVVYESDTLAGAQTTVSEAQRALALFQRAVVLLLVASVVLVVLALVISPNRWRTLAQLGIGLTLVMALAIVIVNRVVDNVPQTISAPGARAATATVLETATTSLKRLITLLALIGVAAAIAGYTFGRSASARAVRERATGVAVEGSAGAASWARRTIGSHADGARVAVLGVAAVILLVWGLSWPTLLVAAAIGVAGLVAIVVLTPARPSAPV